MNNQLPLHASGDLLPRRSQAEKRRLWLFVWLIVTFAVIPAGASHFFAPIGLWFYISFLGIFFSDDPMDIAMISGAVIVCAHVIGAVGIRSRGTRVAGWTTLAHTVFLLIVVCAINLNLVWLRSEPGLTLMGSLPFAGVMSAALYYSIADLASAHFAANRKEVTDAD